MRNNNVLIARFPRSTLGYDRQAVDDFVQQMGTRLEELQIRLDEQVERSDWLGKESETAKRELTKGGDKELAIANALLVVEQRKIAAELEIEGQRINAKKEVEVLLANARDEASSIAEQATHQARHILAHAQLAVKNVETELQQIRSQYNQVLTDLRNLLHMHLNHLPGNTDIDGDLYIEDFVECEPIPTKRPQLSAA